MNINIKSLLVVVILSILGGGALLVRLFQPEAESYQKGYGTKVDLSDNTAHTSQPILNTEPQIHTASSNEAALTQAQTDEFENNETNNTLELNKRDPYYRENALVEVVSLETLREFLDTMNASNFESTSASVFLEQSEEGVQLVIDEFILEEEPLRRGLFLDLLTSITSPEKISLAENLIASSDTQERRAAYTWLAGEHNHASAHLMLIDASYYEQDTTALNELITSISTVSSDEDTFDTAVNRLNELTFHHDADVAKQALGILTGLTQNDQTLNTLNNHIDGNNESLKVAAMESLAFFQKVDSETYDKIQAIAQAQGEPQRVRLLAQELIKVWDFKP